ncbi:MAG: hypothetical protein O3C27_09925 [Actinomycetota bacterium]|nr:hypothetical protein [Actinomycetota bacterium]
MVTALAIILGLVVGGLLVVLRRMTHRALVQRQQLSRQLSEAVTATESSSRREAASLAELGAAQTSVATLTAELEAARNQIMDLDDEIEAADALANDQSAELASMAIENEELRKRLASTELNLLSIEVEAERLRSTVAQLEFHQRSGSSTAAETGLDAATLWRLELARSERTWRHSVAILPDDPSPYGDADDPLRLAIETEVSALRDDVGAFLTADVQPHLTDDPATAHLVLRLAQELLAQASRRDEPSHLVVEHASEASITLTIRASDEGDVLHIDLTELALDDSSPAVVDLARSSEGVHVITLTSR